MLFVVVIFYLIVPNLLALPLNETTPLNKPAERIIGGKDAQVADYPYQASLRDHLLIHFCGGSIIHPKWILTAAHCVHRKEVHNVQVVVGTNYLDTISALNIYNVSKIISHELYDTEIIVNDIALVQVVGYIKFGTLVRAVDLADRNYENHTPAILTGWGRTSRTETSFSNRLQEITLITTDMTQCRKALNECPPITLGQLCTTKIFSNNLGSCYGDFGGPLVNIVHQQIGIASYIVNGCFSDKPAVFTSVVDYRSWIYSVAGV